MNIHDRLQTSILADWTMDTCLPNIEVLKLGVKADQSRLRLARSIMGMKHLCKLELNLYNGDGQHTVLFVSKTSLIELLLLALPSSEPQVSVTILKPDVEFCCYVDQPNFISNTRLLELRSVGI